MLMVSNADLSGFPRLGPVSYKASGKAGAGQIRRRLAAAVPIGMARGFVIGAHFLLPDPLVCHPGKRDQFYQLEHFLPSGCVVNRNTEAMSDGGFAACR